MTQKEIIEQAKEKLNEEIERADSPEREVMKEVLALLEQAEPPAGEFTKRIRGAGLVDSAEYYTSERLQKQALFDLFDACGRLDAQQQEIERLNELVFAFESTCYPVNPLVAENKAQAEEIERLKTQLDNRTKMHNTTREHERALVHEVTRLTAENRELRDAASWADEERHKAESKCQES